MSTLGESAMATGVGFEPTGAFTLPVFWTGSFANSDTPPCFMYFCLPVQSESERKDEDCLHESVFVGDEGETRTLKPLLRRRSSKPLHYHCATSPYNTNCIKRCTSQSLRLFVAGKRQTRKYQQKSTRRHDAHRCFTNNQIAGSNRGRLARTGILSGIQSRNRHHKRSRAKLFAPLFAKA